MKTTILAILMVIPFLISCSQQDDSVRNTLTGAEGYSEGDPVVQAADGSLYSVGCLQSNTIAIQQQGSAALASCEVSLESGSIQAETNGARGKFFTNSYASVYYPPTYYNPSYSYSGYGSNYNWLNDGRFKSDPFCNWLSGKKYTSSYSSSSGSSINWYYLLGYLTGSLGGASSSSSSTTPSYSYGSYYNSSCSQCLYSYNPSACQARCYSQVPIYYY